MKFHLSLLFVLALILPLSLFAQEEQTLEFTGERLLKTTLTAVKTHTEYRTEEVEDTCSREVFDHYENVCRDIPEQSCSYQPRRTCHTIPGQCRTYQGQCRTHCHTVRGQRRCNRVCPPAQTRCEPSSQSCSTTNERVCHTTYRRECNDVARYRTEYYSCMKTVQVPYEVYDYNIEANITIEVAKLPSDISLNEKLTVKMVGEDMALSLSSENAEIVAVITKKELSDHLEDTLKTIDGHFVLEVFKKSDIANELEGIIEETKVIDRKLHLSYKLTRITQLKSLHLNIARDRFIGKDLRIFDGMIPDQLLKPTVKGDVKELIIDLNDLNTAEIKNKKHKFTLLFKFGLGEGFITELKGLKLEVSKNFTQKL